MLKNVGISQQYNNPVKTQAPAFKGKACTRQFLRKFETNTDQLIKQGKLTPREKGVFFSLINFATKGTHPDNKIYLANPFFRVKGKSDTILFLSRLESKLRMLNVPAELKEFFYSTLKKSGEFIPHNCAADLPTLHNVTKRKTDKLLLN